MAKPPCSRRASGSVMLVHTSALRAFAKTRSVGLVLREDVTRSDTWEGCPTCASTTRRRGNHWEDRPASITRAPKGRVTSGQPALLEAGFLRMVTSTLLSAVNIIARYYARWSR
jgi:hypothetical protein